MGRPGPAMSHPQPHKAQHSSQCRHHGGGCAPISQGLGRTVLPLLWQIIPCILTAEHSPVSSERHAAVLSTLIKELEEQVSKLPNNYQLIAVTPFSVVTYEFSNGTCRAATKNFTTSLYQTSINLLPEKNTPHFAVTLYSHCHLLVACPFINNCFHG